MIGWLIETSLAVTFLMLLVLVVRRPVAHFFGAGWAYALWALPALRLVLPPLHLLGDAFPSLFPAKAAAVPVEYAVAPVAAEAGSAFNWEPLLLAVWLGGAAVVVLWQSWRYLAFIRRLGIGSHIHASLAQEIGIIESAEVDGPLAIGLLDRWIVVPADFTTRYTPQEQRLALQHERTHHGREDIFWNMIALGVLALNWFNPVAYLAFRAFRTDQELSCDAAVAAQASSDERLDYALALVKSASRPGLIAACPLNHAGQLKNRLRMMKAHRRSGFRAGGGSVAVGALLLTGISVTDSPVSAAGQPVPAAPPKASAPPSAPVVTAKPTISSGTRAASPSPRRVARLAAPSGSLPRATSAPAAVPISARPPAPDAPTVPPATDPSTLPAAPAPSAATPAPVPPRASIAVIHRDRPVFTFVAANPPRFQEVRLVRTDVRPGTPLPPELAEKLKKALADAGHANTVSRFQIIQVNDRQEN